MRQAVSPKQVPVGLSLFPFELFPPSDATLRRKFPGLVAGGLRVHDKGGHFAALECPEELLADLLGFMSGVIADSKQQ